jgi:DNA helicase-2/ATP-dependent DNA helicase PcrA
MSRDYVLEPFREAIELQIDYAKELNSQQLAAVTAPPGPALVIAGAGSGKTRTLTYRVAYLLEQGIPPERILLLTFTNKAAREMMRRVSDLLGQDLPALWGGTFHSIGNRILRQHADALGFPRQFSIMDREDARHLLATCLGESEIDVKSSLFPKPDLLADLFSLVVNTGRSLRQILEQDFKKFRHLEPQIATLRDAYEKRKLSAGTMDFDDLLVLWLRLLKDKADVLELYQRRFQFILVDEYQDTNHLQSELIDLLAARHHNLMVVGDDAQSIYAWRGADFLNILKFPDRYPGAKTYKIETNYRSTPEILQAANAAIRGNVRQFAKELAAARKSGMKPALVACDDANQQAALVAQRTLQLRDEGVSLNQMAVLYRSHFHALELQLELTKRNIPFSITSGIRFFEQAHIKDVVAYLKLVSNPRDELAFKRIVQMFPGVGGKGAAKMWNGFLDTFDAPPVTEEHGGTPIARALQSIAAKTPKKTQVSWAQFTATVAQLEDPKVKRSASGMIELVMEAGYTDYLKGAYANYRSREDDLEQLAVFARQFEEVNDFLTQLALLTNLEAEEGQPASRDEERLRLSTIHQAKGLEFEVVFVIMLCDGLFPSSRSLESPEGEEEERRLLYVAITRARNELYLTYPVMRAVYGGGSHELQRPSRFLSELPEEVVERWNLRTQHRDVDPF